jgi:hypothetical protein
MNIGWLFFTMFFITAIISWLWVKGLTNMKENHPDYKGNDFLNWEDNEYENKKKV